MLWGLWTTKMEVGILRLKYFKGYNNVLHLQKSITVLQLHCWKWQLELEKQNNISAQEIIRLASTMNLGACLNWTGETESLEHHPFKALLTSLTNTRKKQLNNKKYMYSSSKTRGTTGLSSVSYNQPDPNKNCQTKKAAPNDFRERSIPPKTKHQNHLSNHYYSKLRTQVL